MEEGQAAGGASASATTLLSGDAAGASSGGRTIGPGTSARATGVALGGTLLAWQQESTCVGGSHPAGICISRQQSSASSGAAHTAAGLSNHNAANITAPALRHHCMLGV